MSRQKALAEFIVANADRTKAWNRNGVGAWELLNLSRDIDFDEGFRARCLDVGYDLLGEQLRRLARSFDTADIRYGTSNTIELADYAMAEIMGDWYANEELYVKKGRYPVGHEGRVPLLRDWSNGAHGSPKALTVLPSGQVVVENQSILIGTRRPVVEVRSCSASPLPEILVTWAPLGRGAVELTLRAAAETSATLAAAEGSTLLQGSEARSSMGLRLSPGKDATIIVVTGCAVLWEAKRMATPVVGPGNRPGPAARE